MNIAFYDKNVQPTCQTLERTLDFLYTHLENYGDPREQIRKAMFYALGKPDAEGGFIAVVRNEKEVIGASIINRTGMEGYIPENIIVYIAVHRDYRGQGVGHKLMSEVMDRADGNIALHVEPDNPALFLYKKLGFTNKYLEMRWIREEESEWPV